MRHPPPGTPETLMYLGKARKKGSAKDARKDALIQAMGHFLKTLEIRGYRLTARDRAWWLNQSMTKPGGPAIADSWTRIYQESPDKPYLHRTSMAILLAVPAPFVDRYLARIGHQDRSSFREMLRQRDLARAAMRIRDGSAYLVHLRNAVNADQYLRSLGSFPPGDRARVTSERTQVESLWRRAIRDLDLSFRSPVHPLILLHSRGTPAILLEHASLDRRHGHIGVSGLSVDMTISPFLPPASLTFPDIAWLFGNPRPILSRSTLSWERALAEAPPYRPAPHLRVNCSGTDQKGEGLCTVSHAWVPGRNGTLEGNYRPLPGTALDSAFFRDLLRKSRFEEHFLFVHTRAEHPIRLVLGSVPGLSKSDKTQEITELFKAAGFSVCSTPHRRNPPTCSGPEEIRARILPDATLEIQGKKFQWNAGSAAGLPLTTVIFSVDVLLTDRNGPLWRMPVRAEATGLTPADAADSAWREIARRTTRSLDLFYYRETP